MRVLIRADASPTIGSGHIARCLTLARVLRGQGSHVAFACRCLPGHRLAALRAEGFETFALPERYAAEDPQQAIESMLPWQADIDALAAVLEDCAMQTPGLCLYYSGHRHVPAALRAFIELIQEMRG